LAAGAVPLSEFDCQKSGRLTVKVSEQKKINNKKSGRKIKKNVSKRTYQLT